MIVTLIGVWVLWYWWSRERGVFLVNDKLPAGNVVVGYSAVDTLNSRFVDWLLTKPGAS